MNDKDVERELHGFFSRVRPPQPSVHLREAVVAERAGRSGRRGSSLHWPRPLTALVGIGASLALAACLVALAANGTPRGAAGTGAPTPTPTETASAVPTKIAGPGVFVPTGAMSHDFSAAVPLLDGRVLVLGGRSVEIGDYHGEKPTVDAQTYDPATGKFASTGPMTTARWDSIAIRLQDGRVLIASGADATAELYEPGTGTFSRTGKMTRIRNQAAAALLPDGRVLIVGGSSGPGARTDTAELFDPTTESFKATGKLKTWRSGATAITLADGRVLVAGGIGEAQGGGCCQSTASAEIYDPAGGSFSDAGPMTTERFGHTATLLPDGRVLIAGGSSREGALKSAELFDPATGQFKATGSMADYRQYAADALLADGRVLIVGGEDSYELEHSGVGVDRALSSAEIYDPATGTFSTAASMAARREGPLAALLSDGRVLVAGGIDVKPHGPADPASQVYEALLSAELYQP
jgi:hypothetical protein